MKTLIFISTDKYFPKLKKLVNSLKQNVVTVCGPAVDLEGVSSDLKGSLQLKAFEDYETPAHSYQACSTEAWQLIEKWADLKIDGKVAFADLTSYSSICLWKIYNNGLLLYYFTDLIYYTKIVNSILEQERPDQLILLGTRYEQPALIFSQLAKQKKVPFNYAASTKSLRLGLPLFPTVLEKSFSLHNWSLRIALPFPLYILGLFIGNYLFSLMGKIYNLWYGISKTKKRGFQPLKTAPELLPKAIFLRFKKERPGHYRKILFYSNNKKQLDSVIPLVQELNKDSQNRALVMDWFWKRKDCVAALRAHHIPHRVFAGYITCRAVLSLWRNSRYFWRNWRRIERDKPFQLSLTYNNLLMWNLCYPYLKQLFLRHFVKMANLLAVAENVVDVEKPDIIVVTNEREYTGRLALLAGKLKNIPSLTLQRGAIADLPEWQGPLYTDWMVVDGNFAQQVLVRRKVPPEKLIVAGNPRYDIVKKINIPSVSKKVYQKLALPMDKRLIVLATTFVNPYSNLANKRKLLQAVFSSVKKFPNCHLVVKLHPAESTDHLHQEIAKRVEIKNISIIKEIELWELIASCQMLITAQSTVGIEAILMDKPLISVNLSKIQKDYLPYAESGAAIAVGSEDELTEAIRGIFANPLVQNRLKVARQRFILEHVQNFNAQATEKIARIIVNLLQPKII